MKRKELILTIGLIIIIIITIVFINSLKDNLISDKQTMQCIADNSILIVSKTCGHCAHQKEILGESINDFQILSIDENPDLLEKYNIIGVPTWVINEKTEIGFHSIDELKKLTEC